MNHVGNDIVDLKAPDAIGKSSHASFIKRVLTKNETLTMLNAEKPDTFLWLFWAAKETAYKAISKNTPYVTSSPRKYEVILNLFDPVLYRGRVSTPLDNVHVRFSFDANKVCCIGKTGSENFSQIISGTGRIEPEGPIDFDASSEEVSSFVRDRAIYSLSEYFKEPAVNFKINRFFDAYGNPGPPVVLLHGKPFGVNLSLSHDGRFFAYTWNRR